MSETSLPHGESCARVFCLPPSGAGRSFFRQWPRKLAGALVIPLSRPGHEERMREPFARSIAEAAADVVAKVVRHGPGPAILFGHSLGAAVAFEAARMLEGQGAGHGLVVSGRQAPHLPGRAEPVRAIDSRALLKVLHDWGGPPLRDPDDPLATVLLPAIRADFALSAAHAWDGRPVTVPVTSISYRDDRVVREVAVRAWAEVAGGRYTHVTQQGDHFSARIPSAALIGVLADALARIEEPGPGM